MRRAGSRPRLLRISRRGGARQALAVRSRTGRAWRDYEAETFSMSDYLFMLESHLTPSQKETVAAVEAAGAESGEQTFLVGGAMRDMLGGFPITDLDFVVQGNALALAKKVAKTAGGEIVDSDSHFKTAELRFPTGVTAEIGMARTETHGRTGSRPQVKAAGIHEDLLRRDFSMNSIALSLHPASKGLLLDPCNGAADIELKEIRANGNYGFYDDPVRLLRLVRLRIRLGFELEDRTKRQFANAREAGLEARIPARALLREVRALAGELNLTGVITGFDEQGFLPLISPALKGAKLNLGALSKLEKARQSIPYGVNLNIQNLGLFLFTLTGKLSPKEKSAFIKTLKMEKPALDLWQKLESRSKKLERVLKSTKLHRTSDLYYYLLASAGDEILFLYLHSKERLVHDRIRSFLQKHLFTVLEVTDREVTTMSGLEPVEPDFAKIREEIIVSRLDGRKWKPPVVKKPKPKPKKRTKKAAKKAAKKAVVKKAVVKKAVAKKAPVKKAVAKKAPVKKAVAKKAPVKKVAAKKSPVKKVVAKKSPVKKVVAKKSPAKKAAASKVAAKKAPAKKAPAKKAATKKTTRRATKKR